VNFGKKEKKNLIWKKKALQKRRRNKLYELETSLQFAMTSDSESESDDEEYNKGPDIFEAAADEEIKEDHW